MREPQAARDTRAEHKARSARLRAAGFKSEHDYTKARKSILTQRIFEGVRWRALDPADSAKIVGVVTGRLRGLEPAELRRLSEALDKARGES